MNGFDLSTISDLYVGSTQYSLIYKGSDLIWLSCPYDAKIEYLESNGSQWIDTGITPNSNTKVQFRFMNLAATGNVIIGYYTGDDTTDWRFFNYLNTAYFDVPSVGGGREGTRIYRGTISSNLDYELELGNYYVKDLNSNLNIVSGSNQTFTGYSTITLNSYGVDNHNNSSNRWYYVKIYDGNTLVRDMIPVRIGLTGYMYDKVTRQLFGNNGTGNFILGGDIIPIKYLESTGTLYINTRYMPTGSDIKIEGEYYPNGGGSWAAWFCSYVDENHESYRILKYDYDDNSIVFTCGTNAGSSGTTTILSGTTYTYELTLDKLILNGNVITNSNQTVTGTNTTNLYLFSYPNGHLQAIGRHYYFKVYKNNTLVVDLIPVRVGQIGYMYDKISGNLLGNSGTGSFVLGPDISGGNISDYVQNGLVCHFDGIDKGTGSDWTDLIGGILTTYSGDATKGYSTQNSYYFGSGADYLSSGVVSFSTSSDITVEVCYKEDSSMTRCFVFGFGGTADSKLPLFYKDDSYITWSQGAYVYNISSVGYGDSLTHTMSFNGDNAYHNGTQIPITSTTDYWDAHYGDYRVRIGSAESGGASSNPIRGHVYSIRVYNRKLTSAEQLLNLRVDNLRFGLGLSI